MLLLFLLLLQFMLLLLLFLTLLLLPQVVPAPVPVVEQTDVFDDWYSEPVKVPKVVDHKAQGCLVFLLLLLIILPFLIS